MTYPNDNSTTADRVAADHEQTLADNAVTDQIAAEKKVAFERQVMLDRNDTNQLEQEKNVAFERKVMTDRNPPIDRNPQMNATMNVVKKYESDLKKIA